MCKDCGCGITEPQESHHSHHHTHSNPTLHDTKTVEVLENILGANDEQARHNREHLEACGVVGINLMSSPGAGKTTLLEKTIELLGSEWRIGVIEGDLETERDAERIRQQGVPAHQITTGQACHLDAFMVHEGLHHLPLDDLDVVFVENVGNLVCPAAYDVGTHLNVVLLSVPEGDDKPAKYPVMFRSADLILLTKIDLIPYLPFDRNRFDRFRNEVNPRADFIALSAISGDGLKEWVQWLTLKLALRQKARANPSHSH